MSRITAFLPRGNFTFPERISCFFTLGDLNISFRISLPTFLNVLTSCVSLCAFVVSTEPLACLKTGGFTSVSAPTIESGLGFLK